MGGIAPMQSGLGGLGGLGATPPRSMASPGGGMAPPGGGMAPGSFSTLPAGTGAQMMPGTSMGSKCHFLSLFRT